MTPESQPPEEYPQLKYVQQPWFSHVSAKLCFLTKTLQ